MTRWQAAVLCLYCSVTLGLAEADSGRILGRVLQADGTPVGGAIVALEPHTLTALTDSTGGYSLTGIPAGSYSIVIRLANHVVTESGVEVRAGETREVESRVDWPLVSFETVIVHAASRQPERIVEAPAAVTALSEDEIARQPAHGQLPRLLAFTPGAEPSQSDVFDFSFNTRGYNNMVNRRVLTLIDGRDPALPGVGTQEWQAIAFPMDELVSLELVRGPGSALYGPGAYNGVIDMSTKAPRDTPGGQIRVTAGELDSQRIDFRYAGNAGAGWYFKALAGHQRGEDFFVSRVDSAEYEPDSLPRDVIRPPLDDYEVSYGSLRFDRYFANGNSLNLETGTAEVEGTTTVTGLGRVQQTDSSRPWARVSFNAPQWNALAYYTGQDSNKIIPLSSGVPLYWDTSNVALELQGHTGFAGGRGRVIGGLSRASARMNSDDGQGRQTQLATPVEEQRRSGYGQVEFDFNDRLEGVFTLRLDDSDLRRSELSPRAALVYSVTPRHILRLSYSEAFQSPSLVETSLQVPAAPPIDLSELEQALAPLLGGVPLEFASVALLAVGNENLPVEKVRGFEVGYNGVLGSHTCLTLSYYRNELDNFTTNLLPQLGTSFGRLNPDFGPYVPPPELSAEASTAVLVALAAALPAPLLAVMSNNADGTPIFVAASLGNFGRVDTQGFELGLGYLPDEHWRFDLAYSYFDFDVREAIPEDPLAPNTPKHQVAGGLGYATDRFDAALKGRWVDDFRWASGFYIGPVPSYTVVDLQFNYRVDGHWALGLDAANLLDNEHWEMFGGSVLGRRALVYANLKW